ncbi:MAG: hypothetical protein JST69_10365 [Bacteroidetes bacterium]|nr:hypothetical protein [Bacteroidota bacterium]
MDFFFNQNIGDGANIFITIVALIVGFVSGLSFIDKMKTGKEQEKH